MYFESFDLCVFGIWHADQHMRDRRVISIGLWINWKFELSMFGLKETHLYSGPRFIRISLDSVQLCRSLFHIVFAQRAS